MVGAMKRLVECRGFDSKHVKLYDWYISNDDYDSLLSTMNTSCSNCIIITYILFYLRKAILYYNNEHVFPQFGG